MASSNTRVALLLATSAFAALGYGLVSQQVRRQRTRKLDDEAREAILKLGGAARVAARASGPLGKWYGHLPAALRTAWKLRQQRRTSAALAVIGTSLGAIVLSRALERAMAQRTPPPGRGDPSVQSYPSGHALETSAVSIVTGYTLVREELASAAIALPLSASALASGFGRFVLDRHWFTDLLGGYCAGIALGSASAAVYEWRRAA